MTKYVVVWRQTESPWT